MPDQAEQADRLKGALATRYRLERELGRGGMATVYLAEDLRNERPVAIKVLKPELAAALGPDRFLREIKLTARLDHPHILPLLDSGEAKSLLYYIMPYVEGESLRERLNREKQLPIDDAIQITQEIADALDFAHQHGVLHRDIKPENILLGAGHARVADFGIARAISAVGGDRLTETGLAVGTPEYMSPEQAAAETDLDGRSDVYALGCVLYEMLAGQPPFTAPTVEGVVHQHLTAEPPRVTAVRQAVPPSIAQVVSRALAKTPADRFRSVAQFATALTEGNSAAVAGATAASVAPRSRRHLVLLGGGTVVVLVATLLVLSLGRRSPLFTQPPHERTAIAVLPFQNLSADGPHAYFASGLHDEVLTQLYKVAALKVISRTSVMSYAGPNPPPVRQIANELKVGSIVEGSVQVVGGRLRVNVQLIDAATDEHLWAERYDGTLDDAFAIQSDIARQVVQAVGATLAATEQQSLAQAPTANAEAYRLYIQAREYDRRPGDLRQNEEIAQDLYERAIELDPGFALARAALSQLHGHMYHWREDPSRERAARQWEEAETALRLAPGLPEAHIAMGYAHYWGRGDYQRALDEFAIAVERMPNNGEVWASIGYVQRRLGNWNEAVRAGEKSTQLDPRAAELFRQLGHTYQFLRRYPEAVRAYDSAVTLAPDLHYAMLDKGFTYVLWQGQLDTLRAVLSRLPRGIFEIRGQWQALLYLWERRPDSLLQLLKALKIDVFDDQFGLRPTSLYAAWGHYLRGDRSAAWAAFDSARVLLDSVMRELPDDWRVYAARGLALVGLDRRDEGLQEADRLHQSDVYRRDSFHRPLLAEDRAQILAQAGAVDAALEEIERLLAEPSWLSVHTLRLDPLWDPIRDHRRFQALLAQHRN